jgi:hypothetical protein
MHDTLRNTLSIEVGEQIDEVEVLKKERTILAGTLTFIRMWVGCS